MTGKLRLAYDGIRFRPFVNGTQLGADIPATSPTFTLWPKWHDYHGTSYSPPTGLKAGPYNSSIWQDVGGANRPSDNAGTSGVLTAIGTGSIIVGNTLYKSSGTNGALEGGAVGQAQYGTAFVTASIINAVPGGSWDNYIALDDDATSFTTSGGALSYTFMIRPTTGAGVYTYQLLTAAGGAVASGAGPGALTTNSRMSLVYDGVNVYAIVDGAIIAQTPATAAGQKLFPKVLDFYVNNAALARTDILYGPWSENAWSRVGGTGRPSDYAGTSLSLVLMHSSLTQQGNGITQTVTGTWRSFYSKERFEKTAYMSARLGQTGTSIIVGLKASDPASANDPDGYTPDGACIYYNGVTGNLYIQMGSGAFQSLGVITQVVGETFSVMIDNAYAYFYRNGAQIGTRVAITPGLTWRVAGQIYGGSITDIQAGIGTDRQLDNQVDGTYAKPLATETTGGVLKLSIPARVSGWATRGTPSRSWR